MTAILIDDAIRNIKPLDVIVVRGTSLFARLIAYTEATKLKCNLEDTYSHAGIVISRDIVDDPALEWGKLYLWESCLTHQTMSVHHPNKKFLGSQVRPLLEVIHTYLSKSGGKVGWLSYQDPTIKPPFTRDFQVEFTKIFKKYNNIGYDYNPLSLCAAVFKSLRPVAYATQILTHSEKLMFCSELVARVLIDCNLISHRINPSCVLPQDFLGFDDEIRLEERIPETLFNNVVEILK
jgi:hypothetical protein